MADTVARYAAAWKRRDLEAILGCMHPSLSFVAPNARADSRDAYRASTERFLSLVTDVKVRACIRNGSQAMLAYDFVCRAPIGVSAVAELIRLDDGLIATSEIFFDTAPFAAFAGERRAGGGGRVQ
ncbi:MAG TPA: nuclear transport factor 2 family protein [Sphingomicrobium sp.]